MKLVRFETDGDYKRLALIILEYDRRLGKKRWLRKLCTKYANHWFFRHILDDMLEEYFRLRLERDNFVKQTVLAKLRENVV